jgi:hypothetical protein
MFNESHPQVLRLQYEKELSQAHVTVQTKFNYAWGLVKSPIRDHQVEGVRLLQGKYTFRISLPRLTSCCRDFPGGTNAAEGMSILSCFRSL